MQKTKRPLWLTAALAVFLVAVAVAGCKHDEEDEWTPLTIRGTVLEKYAGQRKSVIIPDGVTGIGSRAFSGSDVAEVVIPPFVTSIAADAFNDSKVESVSYIGSQEDWQKLVGNGLPDGIRVACFITDENGILIRYEGDETDIVIPAGFVKGIAGGVFRDCAVRTGITGVTVPGSVKHIGENAFADCTALADVRIEAGVADIGAGAFAGCTALEALNIPAGVTGLGERIVSGCDRLTELVVHESVTTIAPGAFTGIGQKKITYRAKKAKWEKLVADTGIRQDLAGFTVHCTDGDWNGPEQTATTPGDNTGDTHEHIWGKYIIDGAADGHYQTCKVKGCTARTPTETHVYADDADGECDLCGYLKENPGDPTCEHVFDYKEIDDGYHIKTCMKNCGASSTETHNYGTVTYQEDGHHQTCADCNHLKIESHKYDGAAYENNGADGHSRTCMTTGCDYIDRKEHLLGGYESDGKGGHQKTCTAGCGYSEPVPHDWRDGYTTDADKHYKTCKIVGCTARDKEGTHQYSVTYQKDGHHQTCTVCTHTKIEEHKYEGASFVNGGEGGHYQTCTATDCDVHNEPKAHEPKYEKIDDDTHLVTCEQCDYSSNKPHTISEYESKDDANHYKICEICKERMAVSHNYEYTDSNDSTHTKTCKDCKHSVTETHNYGTVTYQNGGHHQTCADCNHLKIESHKYDGASYENNGADGHSRTCTTEGCGYIETGVHSLGDCESDGKGGHQKTCTAGCGYSEPVQHDWNTTYTTDADKHYKTCKIVGCTARDEEGAHLYEGEPYKNGGASGHYQNCKVCNYQSALVGHTWSATYTNDKNGGHYQTCTATGCNAHSESTPHDPQYEKIDDSNHRVTCKATGCDYSVTEKHQYDKGVCACGSKLELAGGTIENGVLMSYDKKGEKNVVIPDGVTGIGGNAFQNCWGLETVVIPDSVTSIGGSAFAGCHGLTEVTIPGSVDTIGQGAFQTCTGLKEVTIENGVKNIEHGAFERCESLTEVTIPGSVDTIGQGAFQTCTGLKKVTIENGVKVVGNEAFQGCSNLTDVTIPDSVTSIGDNAFEGCVNLRGITISKNVTSIGKDALACGNLENITFTGTVAEWLELSKDSGVGDNVTVTCRADNGTVPWDITEDKTLRHYYGRETDVQIPWESIETIGKAAFAATGVTNVTITEGVKHIDDGAFQGCGSLTHVEIPMSVTIIGYHAFYVCDKLKTITFAGTRAQWGALTTANDIGIGNGVTVTCSDGTITTP